MMMPGLDGYETLKILRQSPQTMNITVVFMTAKIQNHEIMTYKNMGASDTIPKPFDPMTISQQVLDIWTKIYG